MSQLSALVLGCAIGIQLGAQVLQLAELGLPFWKQGDPIEVLNDGIDGFWIRGPSGVLAVDSELKPRPWAAALYLGTAGGLDWFPVEPGFFVVRKTEQRNYLFHHRFPQGLEVPHNRFKPPELPTPPELPWRQVNQEQNLGIDLIGQIWRREGEKWGRVTQMAQVVSVVDTPEGLVVARDGRIFQLREGQEQVLAQWPGRSVVLQAVNNVVIAFDTELGVVHRLKGSQERVNWDFWEAVEQQGQEFVAQFKGIALDQLALGVANLYRQRFGSFGPWLERVALGRQLREGFGRIQVRWSKNCLRWVVDPDDRNTTTPLDVVVVTIPDEVETVQRRAAHRGELQLDGKGALALWIQFFRGREVQEIWAVEEP